MTLSLPKLPVVAVVAAAALALPAAAHATTVSSDGKVVTATGTDGTDGVDYSINEGRVVLSGSPMIAGAGCSDESNGNQVQVSCPLPSGGLVVRLLGGDDRVSGYITDQAPGWVNVDLGAGNDFLETYGADTVAGGAGNDELRGIAKTGDNAFDGGEGNDKLFGGGGSDTLRGGDGDDTLIGDVMETRGADVLDGGAGRDTVDDYMHDDAYDKSPATVTLDGLADDGIGGERDNVVNIEVIQSASGIVFRGTDAAETVIATQVGGKGQMAGMGGDDTLQGTDDDETIDGGAGNDDIVGGYGNDSITGGAGRDKIVGDRDARCNEMACDLSPGSASDTIDAVDGEQDTISCGPGADTVRADAIDVVAADCETVTRAGTGAGGGQPSTGQPNPAAGGAGTPKAALTISGARTLKALKAGRLRVQVTGLRAGAKVRVRALKGRTVLASGSGRANAKGVAKVTVRLTAAGRRALRRAHAVKVTLAAGDTRLALTLR